MPWRRVASGSLAGSGTRPSTATTISGEVPQVTCGLISPASISTSLSNFAPASLCRVFHQATALFQCSPFGANGRPFT